MKTILTIIIVSVLLDNYVLVKFLGVCPFLGASDDAKGSAGMSAAVTLVMTAATALTFPLQKLVLDPLDAGYLQTVVFVLVIAGLVQLLESVISRFMPDMKKRWGIYLPLISANCAIMGVCVQTAAAYPDMKSYGLAVFTAFCCGAGFSLAMWLFSGIRSKMEESAMPAPFRGMASAMIAAAILSLSFAGFAGIAGGLLGL